MWTFPGGAWGQGGGGGDGDPPPRSKQRIPRKTRSKDLSNYGCFGEVPRNHIVELLFHMDRSMNPMHLETATPEEIYACFYMATGRMPSSCLPSDAGTDPKPALLLVCFVLKSGIQIGLSFAFL